MKHIRCILIIVCAATVSLGSENELSPLCDSISNPNDDGCWFVLQGQPRCHLWVAELRKDETIRFEGTADCLNGTLNGSGDLIVNYLDEQNSWQKEIITGTHRNGRAQGELLRRTFHFDDSLKSEYSATYVEGTLHGRVRVQGFDEDGSLILEAYGSFVKGQHNGRFVRKRPNGSERGWDLEEGLYVDSQRHGEWILKDFSADGTLAKEERGPYVEGKKHGDWVELEYGDDESVESDHRGPYVDGKKHGDWILLFLADASGWVVDTRGRYVDGAAHGIWIDRIFNADGTIRSEERTTFVNGEKQ